MKIITHATFGEDTALRRRYRWGRGILLLVLALAVLFTFVNQALAQGPSTPNVSSLTITVGK